MPSRLRNAIGAVKDQTSISLAKVSNTNATKLEVFILKATTHEAVPMEEQYVQKIINLTSSDKIYAAACAQAIGKRISKTRNWIVAVKSLSLVLRIFQDGDPYFPKEVLHAKKRGSKILNLSNFRDDSNSNPWDFAAFVRMFSLYLDERLDCFLTGKLQRRTTTYQKPVIKSRTRRGNEPARDMKPVMLLDRISFWQKLLDRAIATRPTGSAKDHPLVQISLYGVVQESFDLYRDISDGLALLLDSFFHLQHKSCINVFQACVKATKQFEELGSFYSSCKSIGVGRTSEYPSVQQLSEELIETLREFLKDQASFPAHGHSLGRLALPGPQPKDMGSISEQYESCESSERSTDYNSHCTSLGDLASITGTLSPARSLEPPDQHRNSCPWPPGGQSQEQEYKDCVSLTAASSYHSLPTDNESTTGQDLVSFEDWPQPENGQDVGQESESWLQPENGQDAVQGNESKGWEIILLESTTKSPYESIDLLSLFEPSVVDTLFSQSSVSQNHYNPFLQDELELPSIAATTSTSSNHDFSFFPANELHAPTFSAAKPHNCLSTPTFCAQSFTATQPKTTPTFLAETNSRTTTTLELTTITESTFQVTSNDLAKISRQNSNEITTMTPTLSASNLLVASSFQAYDKDGTEPTFRANSGKALILKNANDPFGFDSTTTFVDQNDPFASSSSIVPYSFMVNESTYQESLLQQQRLWSEQQTKIISRQTR